MLAFRTTTYAMQQWWGGKQIVYFGSHKEKATYVLEQEEEGSRKVEVQAKFSGIEYKRGPR